MNWHAQGGTFIPLLLKAGTIDDFNRVVASAVQTAVPLSASTDIFDAVKVAAGVRKILTDAPPAGYGTAGVGEVTCPANQPVVAGSSFTCSASINGAQKSILITVEDDSGRYQVGVPS